MIAARAAARGITANIPAGKAIRAAVKKTISKRRKGDPLLSVPAFARNFGYRP